MGRIFGLALLAGALCGATAEARGVRLVRVGSFSSPVFVTGAPGDQRRIYVVEQGGRIVVTGNGRKRTFLDLSGRVTAGGEQGLLGLAFAPDFARTKRFYVYYTGRAQQQNVVEFRAASRDRARAGSGRRVLRMADHEPNHNGGMLAFGPDGLLYIGTGDGGGGNDQHGARGNAQNRRSLLGKILRIDPRRHGRHRYAIPRTNPFRGRGRGRGEIYAYGLRNPWRFSFDRATGALAIGDVGQDAVEEIDYARRGGARGANFGWRPWEGNRRNFDEPAPGVRRPVITHAHSSGWCSITGGYVVRDPGLPALRGTYLYGDFCRGEIWRARLHRGGASGARRLAGVRTVGAISSFGQDTRGRVYVVSLNGPVYRLEQR